MNLGFVYFIKERRIVMIDLHTHTTASDGDYSPEELIDIAISNGITTLAITDHDNINGIERAINYAMGKNITLIPGIEVSAKVSKGEMHILGLFINHEDPVFQNYLNDLQEKRDNRNIKLVEKFNELGFNITIEDLKKISGGKVIGKPHFAKWFVKNGYAEKNEEVYSTYFDRPDFKAIKRETYEPDDIIKHIKANGGLVILAHPQSLALSFDELKEKLITLKSYGLDGMECYHSNMTPEEMIAFKKIASELNLLISKGSDYHGPKVKSTIELGTGINGNIAINEEIENEILDNMYKAIK